MTNTQSNFKIDESIKVFSWGTNYQQDSDDPSHQYFQKYAKGNHQQIQQHSVHQTHVPVYNTEQSQVKSIETGFRRLKNEQIEKLKDLKNQYDQIKQIKAQTHNVKPPSSHSSPSSQHSLGMMPIKSPKAKGGGREVHILELQKKQLEGMVENSMKKIEELLHNEMQYKKTIHELRIASESKIINESDHLVKNLKKRERDYLENIRLLELERENNLTTNTHLKEKIRYLQSSLSGCEQEIKKILEEKRNHEEIIRIEKDKYLTLEIEFKRSKKEQELLQKDKNSEIQRLLKLKDIKEGVTEKQLRITINTLQQDIKIKDKRYHLLVAQLDHLKKQKAKEDKEHEARLINELVTKNTADPQTKLLQQTLSSIVARINQLERPIQIAEKQIEPDYLDQLENNLQKVTLEVEILRKQLENKNIALKQLEKKVVRTSELEKEAGEAHEKYLEQQRIIHSLQLHQEELILKIGKLQRQNSRSKSKPSLLNIQLERSKVEAPGVSYPASNVNKQLELRIAQLTEDKEALIKNVKQLQNENKQLRKKINKYDFEVAKSYQQAQFKMNLQTKAHLSETSNLLADIDHLKTLLSQRDEQNGKLKANIEVLMSKRSTQNFRLIQENRQLKKQVTNVNNQMRDTYNQQLKVITDSHTEQLAALSEKLKIITSKNEELIAANLNSQTILNENQELKLYLRKMRNLNFGMDHLWELKQTEYQKSNEILQAVLHYPTKAK